MTSVPREDILLSTGLGTTLARGLSREEAVEVRQAWAGCLAEPDRADPSGQTPTAELARGAHGWLLHHEHLVYTATQSAITAGIGTHLLLHGASLADPEGRAIALAAASGTGKSTATRTLARHLGYVTDETVIVHPVTRVVTPFAKPLSLFVDSDTRPKTQFSPRELGLLSAPQDLRLHALAVLDRVREPSERITATASRLSLLDALELIIPQTSSLAQLDRGLVQLAGLLDQLGGAVRLHYSEAEDLLPLVKELLDAPNIPALDRRIWRPADPSLLTPVPGPEVSEVPAGLYRRSPLSDALVVEEGTSLAVLQETSYHVVSGLGPVLWELLADWVSEEDLVGSLLQTGDAPADAADRIHGALTALCYEGLAVRSDAQR